MLSKSISSNRCGKSHIPRGKIGSRISLYSQNLTNESSMPSSDSLMSVRGGRSNRGGSGARGGRGLVITEQVEGMRGRSNGARDRGV